MRNDDLGPATEGDPVARVTGWDDDHGTRGFVARDRPFIDDQPTHRHDWGANSRWGSRPVGKPDWEFDRGRTTAKGFFHLGWTRIRNTFRFVASGASPSR